MVWDYCRIPGTCFSVLVRKGQRMVCGSIIRNNNRSAAVPGDFSDSGDQDSTNTGSDRLDRIYIGALAEMEGTCDRIMYFSSCGTSDTAFYTILGIMDPRDCPRGPKLKGELCIIISSRQ